MRREAAEQLLVHNRTDPGQRHICALQHIVMFLKSKLPSFRRKRKEKFKQSFD